MTTQPTPSPHQHEPVLIISNTYLGPVDGIPVVRFDALNLASLLSPTMKTKPMPMTQIKPNKLRRTRGTQ